MAMGELIINALTTKNSTWWYVAPTYRQAKNIAWRMLLELYYNLPKELQGAKNEAELWIEVGNKGRIELKGADNEDSLRGVKLNGVVIDEVASIKGWDTLWEEVLRPSLTDLRGTGMFISTPKGFNHFHEMYLKEAKDSDYKSFRFTSYDNPLLDPKEIEKAQVELSEDAFAQEYLADFRKQTGLIYKEFDRKIHVKPDFDLNLGWRYYRAMDFGAVNATVCLWIAVDNSDAIYVFDEYYNSGQTSQFHANIIKGKSNPDYEIMMTFGDPSAKQEILDYASFEVFVTPAVKVFEGQDKDWVNSGIEKVRQALKVDSQTGHPRLYIHQRCVNTLREFETYHWLEAKDKNMKDEPEKKDDHCMDALRYFMVSYNPTEINYSSPYQPPVNKYTGYSNVDASF